MKKFLKAFRLFVRMYLDGFFFSDNSHKDLDGTRWGFYRFNHKNEFALFDIDYSFDNIGSGYYHVHGDDVREHWEKDGTVTKRYRKSEKSSRS